MADAEAEAESAEGAKNYPLPDTMIVCRSVYNAFALRPAWSDLFRGEPEITSCFFFDGSTITYTAEPAYSRFQGIKECFLLKEKSIITGVE